MVAKCPIGRMMRRMDTVKHHCPAGTLERFYEYDYRSKHGAAFTDITYIEGDDCWGADNGEYRSPVAFCPWCGEALTVPTHASRHVSG
jgi:hypothetical protein